MVSRLTMKIILAGIYMFLTTLGLILMKFGGNIGTIEIFNKDITLAINGISLIGLFCYIISFLLYIKLITIFNLSYIVPLSTGIVQILILLSSKFIFKEEINTLRLIGIILVIIGVIVMNIPKISK